MPTGYTYPVAEGKITDFKKFALTCARAFGALIEMRDEPINAEIPEAFKPSSYNAERLEEARKRLAELQSMTAAGAEKKATASFNRLMQAFEESRRGYAEEDARMTAMLEAAKAWEPPTKDHIGLKDFMIEQLTESMHGEMNFGKPVKKSGADWLASEIAKAKEDIAYHTREQEKEVERTNGRTEWVQALRQSLSK
jgi:hypothetical protein